MCNKKSRGKERRRTLLSAGNSDSSTVFLSLLRGMHPCSLKAAYLITRMGARGSIDPTMDFSTSITCGRINISSSDRGSEPSMRGISNNNTTSSSRMRPHTHLAAIQAEATQMGDLLRRHRVGSLCRLAACVGLLWRGGPVPSRPLRRRSSRSSLSSRSRTSARAGNLGPRHVLGTAHLGRRPTHGARLGRCREVSL